MPRPSWRQQNEDDWNEKLKEPAFVEFLKKFNYPLEYPGSNISFIINTYKDYLRWKSVVDTYPEFASVLEKNGLNLEDEKHFKRYEIQTIYHEYITWKEKLQRSEDFVKFLKEFNYSEKFDRDTYQQIYDNFRNYLPWKTFISENPEYFKDFLDSKLTLEEYTKNKEAFEEAVKGWNGINKAYQAAVNVAKKEGIACPKVSKLYENRKLNESVQDFLYIMELALQCKDVKAGYTEYAEVYEEYKIAKTFGLTIKFSEYCYLRDTNENYLYELIGSAYCKSPIVAQAEINSANASLRKVQSKIASGFDKKEKKSILSGIFNKEKSKKAIFSYAINRHKTTYSLEDLLKASEADDYGAKADIANKLTGCYNATEKVLNSPELQKKCCGLISKSEMTFDRVFDYFWQTAEHYRGKVYDVESFLLLPHAINMGVYLGDVKRAQISATQYALEYTKELFGTSTTRK